MRRAATMEATPSDVRLRAASVGASALLHAALCLFVLLLPVPARMPSPRQDAVEVEIVTLPAPAEGTRATQGLPEADVAVLDGGPESAAKPPAVVQPDEPGGDGTAMVKPTRMLSEGALADPRSRKARRELAALAPADRIEQLCGLEAMAQVGAWSKTLRPDRVVAYAMAEPKMVGNVLTADGAALHSGREWYRLRLRCELAPDRKTVAAFEFRVGDPIPRSDWEANSLPDEDGPLD